MPALPTTDPHDAPQTTRAVRSPMLFVAYPSPAALGPLATEAPIGRIELERGGVVDAQVSRAHARIVRRNQTSTIIDLGSRNGTWLGGTRLKPGARTPLRDGDVLRLGRTLLVFREHGPADPSPSAPLCVGTRRFVGPWFAGHLARTLEALSARPPSHVLVSGPTGSGKELVARLVHQQLARGNAPWIATNVATLGAELAASQLFGHERGAFTGAVRAHAGLLRAAHGGTLFLDEIGDLPLAVQPMLLRFLQERVVTAVGSYREVPIDVRVVAAGDGLSKLVDEGKFRRDLYERLREAVIEVPPLRERPEDLWAIACELVPDLRAVDVEVEAVERLMTASLPGNVRQLAATLATALRGAPRLLGLQGLPPRTPEPSPPRPTTASEAREMVQRFGTVAAAARGTGVPATTLRRLMSSPRGGRS